MEIGQFNINVKPVWFTDSRVYQFPTQVVALPTGNEDMGPYHVGRYDCKIQVDGEFKKVLTFDLQLDENSIGHVTDIMAQVLELQVAAAADSTEFKEAFTLLRLCYYASYEQ